MASSYAKASEDKCLKINVFNVGLPYEILM